MTHLDVTKPNIARMYDYWLGGKDNFESDRQAAEVIRQRRPNVADQALDNKKFQTRAITHVAGQGVRQFLDLPDHLHRVGQGPGRPRFRQHLQRPGRPADLRPLLG